MKKTAYKFTAATTKNEFWNLIAVQQKQTAMW